MNTKLIQLLAGLVFALSGSIAQATIMTFAYSAGAVGRVAARVPRSGRAYALRIGWLLTRRLGRPVPRPPTRVARVPA
jgi:hypothetical protein